MQSAIDLSPPFISICIPTLGGYDHLFECLKSIKEHTPYEYEVIIIDSANKPRGYTIPMNRAMAAAQGDVLIAFNDDVVVGEGWIEPLLQAWQDGHWVVTPDQREIECETCLCGWCVLFDAKAYREHFVYDEAYVLWCTDVEIAKICHQLGRPPVCVKLPEGSMQHASNSTTVTQQWCGIQGMLDIQTYEQKWGSNPNHDKHTLLPTYLSE